MKIVLDLIPVLIVLFCAWRGFRDGIIRGICGILAVIISLYGASLVADVYTDVFSDVLHPFVSGIVDNTTNKTLADTDPATALTETEKADVYTVSFTVLKKIGFSDGAADIVAKETAEENDKVSQVSTSALADKLSYKLMNVLLTAIAFILLMIIFTVISNVINLHFKIPGIEKVEPYIGILLGIARGILIMYAFASIFRYTGLLIPESTMEQTKLLIKIRDNNPIAARMGL